MGIKNMKKDEREKFIEILFGTIKNELPRMIKEELQSIMYGNLEKITKEMEKELNVDISQDWGFNPLEPRLRRILFDIRARKRAWK